MLPVPKPQLIYRSCLTRSKPLRQYPGLHQNVFMLAAGFESNAMFISGTMTLSRSLTPWHYGRCRNLASLTIAAHSSLTEAFSLHLPTPVSRRSFSTSSSHFSYLLPAFSCHLGFPLSSIFSILLFHTLSLHVRLITVVRF